MFCKITLLYCYVEANCAVNICISRGFWNGERSQIGRKFLTGVGECPFEGEEDFRTGRGAK